MELKGNKVAVVLSINEDHTLDCYLDCAEDETSDEEYIEMLKSLGTKMLANLAEELRALDGFNVNEVIQDPKDSSFGDN